MKKLLIFITLLIALATFISAQDIVTLRSGQEIKTKIKRVGVTNIEYVRYDNTEGPVYEVLKSEVFKVKYANGVEDVFAESIITSDGSLREGTFIDKRDSVKYRWVDIGDQRWMGENLKYNDGKSPCPQSEENECDECGRYYQFENALVACPEGWHLPSDEDWMELEMEAGMSQAKAGLEGWRRTRPGQASALLLNGETGLDLWLCGETNKNNISKKNPKYSVIGINKYSYYWTSKEAYGYSMYAIMRQFNHKSKICKYRKHVGSRYSVRCVKDDGDK